MTIEEKVRAILNEYRVRCVHGKKYGINTDQATQSIIALIKPQQDIDTLTKSAYLKGVKDGEEKMKPMSREKLYEIFRKQDVYLPEHYTALADAILAEWGKE